MVLKIKNFWIELKESTAQKMKFSIQDSFSKCDQILNGNLHFLWSGPTKAACDVLGGEQLLQRNIFANLSTIIVYTDMNQTKINCFLEGIVSKLKRHDRFSGIISFFFRIRKLFNFVLKHSQISNGGNLSQYIMHRYPLLVVEVEELLKKLRMLVQLLQM